MPLPASPVLQELDGLVRTSSDFSEQLYNVLSRRDYLNCEKNLDDGDVMWLVDYLDRVCCHAAFPYSPLRQA